MGIKKQLLYATLFASSCLFSTTVVKADQVNNNAESNISQNTATNTQVHNTTDTVFQATSENTVTKPDTSTENSAQTSSIKTNSVQNNSTQSNQTQAQAVQNTQVTQDTQRTDVQQNHTDEAVDGVYTVGNQNIILYDGNGARIGNRMLAANTGWLADTRRTMGNGSMYYRVSTTEYVDNNSGVYRDYAQPYSGTATVVYKTGASVHDFEGFGRKATYLGHTLPTGSSWKISSRAQVGGKNWYQVGNNTWVPQDYIVVNNEPHKEASWISGVPLIAQRPELPNGCEITAVTMMLQYAGAKVNKMQMAREMPRSGDPNYGYIGQPWDSTGITIFPPALMSMVEKYAGSAKNLTGQGFDAIKYQINLGHPVVTWNTLYGFPYHALVVTGYDKNYVYYNDCWANQTLQMGINQFINNWNTQKRRAISY